MESERVVKRVKAERVVKGIINGVKVIAKGVVRALRERIINESA